MELKRSFFLFLVQRMSTHRHFNSVSQAVCLNQELQTQMLAGPDGEHYGKRQAR